MRPNFVTATRMICLLLLCSIPVIAQTAPTNSAATTQDCGKDACKAAENANTAATNANTAASTVNTAVNTANAAASNANTAAGLAKDAAGKANQASDKAEGKVVELRGAAQAANDASGAAQKAAKDANSGTALQRLMKRKGISAKRPLDDYVPCLFDGGQDFDLRARGNPYDKTRKPEDPLTELEAAQIVTSVMESMNALARNKPQPWQSNLGTALSNFDPGELVGMRPDLAAQYLTKKLTDKLAKPESANVDKMAGLVAMAQQKKNVADTVVQGFEMINPLSLTFKRPEDVSCSFSILGWQETSDNFGRRVANNYVAIQVNIRNLSKDNEFLIHDVQIAVDTGMSMAQFGRFQSGRDKLIVRSVAQRGQSEDRRNLILNTMQMIGNIAGGASTAFTQATTGDADTSAAGKLSTAVALFQGPFITGLINIFPDHTLEHINHISDLVFSASSTNKTVVPVQGSVPLVTFLTEKPLEQMPFSRCGTTIEPIFRRHGWDPRFKKQGSDDEAKKDPGSVKYDFCGLSQQLDDDDTAVDPGAYTRPLHYKKWHAAALQALQRNIYVVIAGVHIQELTNDPVVNNVKCPVAGPDNVVDLSSADTAGNVSCTLNGKNLDRTASASLVSGANKVTATIQAASDGNSATLSVPAANFKGVSASYGLMLRDTTGKDIDAKQTIQFGVRKPKIKGVDPLIIKDGTKPLAVILRGQNLDRIQEVTLTDSADKPLVTGAGTFDAVKANAEELSVQFAASDVQNLLGGTSPGHMRYKTIDDDANTPPTVDPTNIKLVKPPTAPAVKKSTAGKAKLQ